MKGKKFATRAGAVFLAIMLACTFFSKSLASYLTPKVSTAYPQPGILKKELSMQGAFEAPHKSEVTIEDAKNYPAKIQAVLVKSGDTVKAGDVIAKAEVGGALKNEVMAAEKELETLKIGLNDWKHQLENALLDIKKQLLAQEEQKRTLKQNLQAFKAKAEREKGVDTLLPNDMEGKLLYGVANGIDVFNIWHYMVIAIGMAKVSKVKKAYVYGAVGIVFVIGLLITGMQVVAASALL